MSSAEFKGICLTVRLTRIFNIELEIVLLTHSYNPVKEGHTLFSTGLLDSGTENPY